MRKFLVVLLFLLLTIPSIGDLLKPAAYTSHDLTHHIVRTIVMDKILSEGQFPPRWTGELNFGYGYPLFLFNYPLPSYVASVVHHLGLSYIWSVKLTFLASMVASAVFAFILFSYLFKSVPAGFVGGLFYLYAPIRFVNVYVSATFGNAVAFAFVPLVFWAIIKIYRGDVEKKILWGAVSLAALILTHNIMALMFLPVMIVFAVFLFALRRRFYFLKYTFLTFALGFGLAGFFLIPAFFEKSLIRYDDLLTNFWGSNFPTLGQLIHSHWGYGFSHPGTLEDDMSFQIGLAHILVVMVATALLFYNVIKKRAINFIALFFVIVFFVSVYFMLHVSSIFWSSLPFLPYLQMPWRILAVSVFAATVLAAYLVWRFENNLLVVTLLVLAVFVANRNFMRINQIFNVGDDYYMRVNNSTTMASEHLPKQSGKFEEGSDPKSKLEFIDERSRFQFLKNTSGLVVANIWSDREDKMRFNQVYFAGWTYKIDGRVVLPRYLPSHPLPEFVIAPGVHTFEAYFARTRVRLVADMVSVLSLLLLIYLFFVGFGVSKRRRIKVLF